MSEEVDVGRLYGRVYWEFQTGCGVAQGTLTGLVELSVRIEELDIDKRTETIDYCA